MRYVRTEDGVVFITVGDLEHDFSTGPDDHPEQQIVS
jgi:hypothetical protein